MNNDGEGGTDLPPSFDFESSEDSNDQTSMVATPSSNIFHRISRSIKLCLHMDWIRAKRGEKRNRLKEVKQLCTTILRARRCRTACSYFCVFIFLALCYHLGNKYRSQSFPKGIWSKAQFKLGLNKRMTLMLPSYKWQMDSLLSSPSTGMCYTEKDGETVQSCLWQLRSAPQEVEEKIRHDFALEGCPAILEEMQSSGAAKSTWGMHRAKSEPVPGERVLVVFYVPMGGQYVSNISNIMRLNLLHYASRGWKIALQGEWYSPEGELFHGVDEAMIIRHDVGDDGVVDQKRRKNYAHKWEFFDDVVDGSASRGEHNNMILMDDFDFVLVPDVELLWTPVDLACFVKKAKNMSMSSGPPHHGARGGVSHIPIPHCDDASALSAPLLATHALHLLRAQKECTPTLESTEIGARVCGAPVYCHQPPRRAARHLRGKGRRHHRARGATRRRMMPRKNAHQPTVARQFAGFQHVSRGTSMSGEQTGKSGSIPAGQPHTYRACWKEYVCEKRSSPNNTMGNSTNTPVMGNPYNGGITLPSGEHLFPHLAQLHDTVDGRRVIKSLFDAPQDHGTVTRESLSRLMNLSTYVSTEGIQKFANAHCPFMTVSPTPGKHNVLPRFDRSTSTPPRAVVILSTSATRIDVARANAYVFEKHGFDMIIGHYDLNVDDFRQEPWYRDDFVVLSIVKKFPGKMVFTKYVLENHREVIDRYEHVLLSDADFLWTTVDMTCYLNKAKRFGMVAPALYGHHRSWEQNVNLSKKMRKCPVRRTNEAEVGGPMFKTKDMDKLLSLFLEENLDEEGILISDWCMDLVWCRLFLGCGTYETCGNPIHCNYHSQPDKLDWANGKNKICLNLQAAFDEYWHRDTGPGGSKSSSFHEDKFECIEDEN